MPVVYARPYTALSCHFVTMKGPPYVQTNLPNLKTDCCTSLTEEAAASLDKRCKADQHLEAFATGIVPLLVSAWSNPFACELQKLGLCQGIERLGA